MAIARVLGVVGAVILHGGLLLFGGIFFLGGEEDFTSLQEVELITEDERAADRKPHQPPPEPQEIRTEAEEPPDGVELLKDLEASPVADAPALDAASLAAIEAALGGQGGGGGDFASALDFSSGGRIGGQGRPGALDERLEGAFSLAEIDQKPRAVFQAAPVYPAAMRGRKVEGVVSILFVVDSSGRVSGPRVEKSTHAAFEKPALDAVRQWRFEPAVKGGQRVACKMRVPIRFQPS